LLLFSCFALLALLFLFGLWLVNAPG
jgi:hypothetical protein